MDWYEASCLCRFCIDDPQSILRWPVLLGTTIVRFSRSRDIKSHTWITTCVLCSCRTHLHVDFALTMSMDNNELETKPTYNADVELDWFRQFLAFSLCIALYSTMIPAYIIIGIGMDLYHTSPVILSKKGFDPTEQQVFLILLYAKLGHVIDKWWVGESWNMNLEKSELLDPNYCFRGKTYFYHLIDVY